MVGIGITLHEPASCERSQGDGGGQAPGGNQASECPVDHAPDFAEGWNARATAYYLIGQHELSLNDIGRTLMLEPRHFGAISGYAMIMEAWGNHAAALKAHELVQEMYPTREGLAETIARLRKKTSGLSI